jgi:hypothetical protein
MRHDEGFQPTLRKLVSLLDRFGIRFHLTGGIASVAYGEPRLTQDIDLVVDAKRLIAVESDFVAALSDAGFVFGEATVRRSIASGGRFQLLEPDEVVKLDIYTRCLIPGELDRSVRAEIFPGMSVPLVARTDAALSKLIWISRGSHRSRRDLRWILAGAKPEELATVRVAARDMDLGDLLDQVLDEADEIER